MMETGNLNPMDMIQFNILALYTGLAHGNYLNLA